MAFHGTYDHNLDAKNRVTVPSKFRASLSDGLVLAKGVDRFLTVWPASEHARHVAGTLDGRDPIAEDTQVLRRFLFSQAHDTELDAAGRIMIPPPLMAHASFEKAVVVSGLGTYFELWEPAAWAKVDAGLPEQVRLLTSTTSHAG